MTIRNLVHSECGAALVEFGLAAPLLLFLVLGIANYGALMNDTAALEGATRAIAEYAKNSQQCNTATGGGYLADSGCIAGIKSFVSTLQASDNMLSSATATFTPSVSLSTPGNYCTCTDGTVPTGGCSGTCKVASGDNRLLQYIQVTGTVSKYTPWFTVTNFYNLGSLGLPSSLTSQTTIRVE
jgi:Flp pilus assembly protein TadG